jgi:hypothetical protein
VQLRHTALFVTSLYPRPLENLLRLASSEDPCYFAFRFGLHKLVTDRGEGAIVCIPRIRYRDLILSRRQWWIPRRELPQRLAGETAMGCFLKLDAWRRKLGLPQRVFVRRHSLDKVLERDISNNKKPLFIDFSSPIMSRMIGRVLNSDFDYLSLEEALPDHRQRFVSDARCSYASEIIFEQAGDSARSHAH